MLLYVSWNGEWVEERQGWQWRWIKLIEAASECGAGGRRPPRPGRGSNYSGRAVLPATSHQWTQTNKLAYR